METKKVIIFIAKLEMGGAERVASTLANYWAEQSWDVMLLTQAPSESDFYKLQPTIERRTLNLLEESGSLGAALKQNYYRIRSLRKIFKAYQPHAVISLLPQSNTLAILSATGLSCKIIVSERSNPLKDPLSILWKVARRAFYRFADHVVLQSSGVLEWATDFIPHSKIKVIPNPLISHFNLNANHEFVMPSGHIIIAMGRLSVEKNYNQLISAFSLIAKEIPTSKLVILGEGNQRPLLEKLIHKLDLHQQVYLPGKIAQPHALVAKAQIIALSSEYEGFPNALLEGMALGLAAISYDCPYGPADLIDNGTSGFLVPVGNTHEMAKAMSLLLTSPALIKSMSKEARKVNERYATKKIMRQWEALI